MPIINIPKRRHVKFSDQKINWGSGRLSGFESFYGFAAKFCRLNQLKPYQFRRFWLELLSNEDDAYRTRVEKISLLLNEPPYLIRTVFVNNYVNSKWPQFEQPEFEFCPNKMSFCHLCLKDGYHACFHEHEWLNKCPIHRVDITEHDIPYSSQTKADRYLSFLMSLLDLNCPDWYLLDGKYRQQEDVYQNKYFYDYLSWLIKADSSSRDDVNTWIAEIGCNSFAPMPVSLTRSKHFIILSKLGVIDYIASDILNIFSENDNFVGQVTVDKYILDNNVNLNLKITDYIISYLVLVKNNKIKSYRSLLIEEINALFLSHSPDSCDCVWGINNRNELINCLPGELKYLGDYMCPYEFAANELSDRWLNFSTDANPFFQKLDFYSPCKLKILFSSGIVDENVIFLDKDLPIFEINWTKQTTLIIDLIIQKIVQANIDELRHWLISIKEGEPPTNRKRFRPNIYLMQDNNSGLQLISWPAATELTKST